MSSRIEASTVRSRTNRRPLVRQATDARRIASNGAGRRAALRAAYECHGGDIWRLAQLLCGSGVAEGIVHDVFLKLHDEPDSFEPEDGALRDRLLTMAYEQSLHALRDKVGPENCMPPDSARATPAESAQPANTRTRFASASEALSWLPAEERDAITLTYVGRHTYHYATDVLDLPDATVQTRVRDGLIHLRGRLSNRSLDYSSKHDGVHNDIPGLLAARRGPFAWVRAACSWIEVPGEQLRWAAGYVHRGTSRRGFRTN